MRAFRIGFILTLSLLLIVMVGTLTFGFYSAPEGPKAPKYPSSTSYLSTQNYNTSDYSKEMEKYQEDQKKYEKEQKTFVQDKIVPYTRNIFVIWLVLLVAFQVVGLVLSKYSSALVGAAYSFSGVWAIFFGPLGGMIWFANSLVSSFSRQAEATFSVNPILQSVGITSLISVVVLTAMGILFYGKINLVLGKKEIVDPPITPSEPPTAAPKPPAAPSLSPRNP